MSRIANPGTETMGELIDQVLREMMVRYTISPTEKRSNVEKYQAVHHALEMFAWELRDTFTGRYGDQVGNLRIGGE